MKLRWIVLAAAAMAGSCTAPPAPTPSEGADGTVRLGLKNGLTVLIRAERSQPRVAIVTVYRAGIAHEPEGKPQVAHLAEHLVLKGGARGFKPLEAHAWLQARGLVNAETIGNLVHLDHVVAPADLAQVLRIEAARLGGIDVPEDLLATEAGMCRQELEAVRTMEGGSIFKFALMAGNQAWRHGSRDVRILTSPTAADVKEFHATRYATSGGIVAIVGDVDTQDAAARVREILGGVARTEPGPTTPPAAFAGGDVSWDGGADAVIIASPRAPAGFSQRMALGAFGAFLGERLQADAALASSARGVLCTGPLYPVGELPFFVFGEPRPGTDVAALATQLEAATAAAIDAFDAAAFDRARMSLLSFLQSSVLASPDMPGVTHDMRIGQEALNLGIREVLREGMAETPALEEIQKLTHAGAAEVVRDALAAPLPRFTLRGAPPPAPAP